jgi:hypothetical protein
MGTWTCQPGPRQYASMLDPDKERFERALDRSNRVTLAVVAAAVPGVVLMATIYPPPWPTWLAIGYGLLIALVGVAVFVRARRRK